MADCVREKFWLIVSHWGSTMRRASGRVADSAETTVRDTRVGRAHAIAAVIKDAAGQQGLGLHPADFVTVFVTDEPLRGSLSPTVG
jgi:hypothetical protein